MVYLNAKHSKRVDEALNQVTTALIATPFYFGGKVQGVISCVQLKKSADAPRSGRLHRPRPQPRARLSTECWSVL